jgi:catechol 2,3-dioxygenase-like lactoylglutathione lyase family enzyme
MTRRAAAMTTDPLDALRLPVIPVEPRQEFADGLLRRITGAAEPTAAGGATVRYFVRDLDTAVAFYQEQLGFSEELRSGSAFAMLYRGDLRLLLSVPGLHGAGRRMPDGRLPAPGGWNRIALQVVDLPAVVAALTAEGASFRSEIAVGVGVRQILIEDPSGNLIELFEPGTRASQTGVRGHGLTDSAAGAARGRRTDG